MGGAITVSNQEETVQVLRLGHALDENEYIHPNVNVVVSETRVLDFHVQG